MVLEKHKIFEAGNHIGKGDFPIEKVSEILNKTKDKVQGFFAHTSYNKPGETSLHIADFQNFKIENEDIYADIILNEDGTKYFEDGSLSGVSVEILDDCISGIAFTPKGVKPYIPGTEFEENGLIKFGIEFEEGTSGVDQAKEVITYLENLDVTTLEQSTIDELFEIMWNKQDAKYYVDKLTKEGYKIEAPINEFEGMTPSEIKESIQRELSVEMNARNKAIKEFEALKEKGVITKAMEEEGLTSEFFEATTILEAKTGDSIEFEDNKYNVSSILTKALNKVIPPIEFGELNRSNGTNVNPEKVVKDAKYWEEIGKQ